MSGPAFPAIYALSVESHDNLEVSLFVIIQAKVRCPQLKHHLGRNLAPSQLFVATEIRPPPHNAQYARINHTFVLWSWPPPLCHSPDLPLTQPARTHRTFGQRFLVAKWNSKRDCSEVMSICQLKSKRLFLFYDTQFSDVTVYQLFVPPFAFVFSLSLSSIRKETEPDTDMFPGDFQSFK